MWREDENSTIKALISKNLIEHDSKGRPFPPEPMLPQLNGDDLKAPDEVGGCSSSSSFSSFVFLYKYIID
jgi:hypothetical protein